MECLSESGAGAPEHTCDLGGGNGPSSTMLHAEAAGPGRENPRRGVGLPKLALSSSGGGRPVRAMPATEGEASVRASERSNGGGPKFP